jgi:hypothetical protein
MPESTPESMPAHEDLLGRLSLEEKISLLTGADFWSLHGHPAIGLRPIRTSDGPAGVRGPRWDERDTALNVPAPVALAATWDPCRTELMGSLLAAECRRKNVDVLLAPPSTSGGCRPDRRVPGSGVPRGGRMRRHQPARRRVGHHGGHWPPFDRLDTVKCRP